MSEPALFACVAFVSSPELEPSVTYRVVRPDCRESWCLLGDPAGESVVLAQLQHNMSLAEEEDQGEERVGRAEETFQDEKQTEDGQLGGSLTCTWGQRGALAARLRELPAVREVVELPGWLSGPICSQLENLGAEPPPELRALVERAGLYPYQAEAVFFAVARAGRAWFGDTMGLGKTRQAVVAAEYFRGRKAAARGAPARALVLCPSSLCENWGQELAACLGVEARVVRKSGEGQLGAGAEVAVMSYTLFTKSMHQQVATWNPDVLVLDECHYLKESSSQRTRAVTRLSKRVEHVLLLTGTLLSKHVDLFSQLRLLAPMGGSFWPFQGRFGSLAQRAGNFASRFCSPRLKLFAGQTKIFDFAGDSHRVELARLLRCFVVRRTKEEVLDLPRKTRAHHHLPELPPDKLAWFQAELQAISAVRENQGSRPAEVLLMKLVRDTVDLKLPRILEYLRSSVLPALRKDPARKVLLFAHHHRVLDEVAGLVRAELGETALMSIDGRTPTKQRLLLCDRFQVLPAVRVAVLGICSAGTGLNLYRASRVFFLELGWDEKALLQAEDRAHRIGATEEVVVTYVVMRGSTDDTLLRSIRCKRERSEEVLQLATAL